MIRQLSKASDRSDSVLERLSSGQRINKASDDAAGLSIATNLEAKSRVFNQALRNINDGFSLLNIAQGAISSLTDITTRQKELAEQAANGVYSSQQRIALNKESAALVKEYNRIIESTTFNQSNILDGDQDSVRIQQGFGVEGSTLLELGKSLGVAAGDGTFGATTATGTSIDATSIVLADLNHDGKLDVVSDFGYANIVAVGLGNGDGSFTASTVYSGFGGGSVNCASPDVGDVDGDGILDVVFGDGPSGKIGFLKGVGDGTFKPALSIATSLNPGRVKLADLNNDGLLDIIATDPGAGKLQFLYNNGQSQFTPGQSLDISVSVMGPNQILTGDLTGDGRTDIIVSSISNSAPQIITAKNDGSYNQARGLTSLGIVRGYNSVVTGDFNGDGSLDLASNDSNSTFVSINEGQGVFATSTQYSGHNSWASKLAAADINGDGNLDLIHAAHDTTSYTSLLGKADGTFSTGASTSKILYSHDAAYGDLNNDGVLDQLTGGSGGSQYFVNLGNVDATGRRNNHIQAFDLLTIQGAREALTRTADYLSRLTNEQGNIGAFQSRLSASFNVLSAASENYVAARSRIIDADVAADSAELTSTSIAKQAAAAILAQTNLQPQLALKLLQ